MDRNSLTRFRQFRFTRIFAVLAGFLLVAGSENSLVAQQKGEPIWSPLTEDAANSVDTVFFRKSFTLVSPAEAQLTVEATNSYRVYLNSQLVHQSRDGSKFSLADARKYAMPGLNLLAIEVDSKPNGKNSVQAYFRMREQGETRWRAVGTDTDWATSEIAHPMWQSASFPDRGWLRAQIVGKPSATTAKPRNEKLKKAVAETNSESATSLLSPLAAKLPASQASSKINVREDNRAASPSGISDENSKDRKSPEPNTRMPEPDENSAGDAAKPEFKIADGFSVQAMVANEECGSLIAMTFDESGFLIVSREGGGLLSIDLTRPAGTGRSELICDEVKNCQGILALNGNLYVTGDGPSGLGLYELVRKRPEKKEFRVEKTLIKFTGQPGEHGPHGVTLGPDGKIYVVVGNGSQLEGNPKSSSPYRDPVDINIVPRFEDPGGHAVGVRAPGGTIVRVSVTGGQPEIVAGGIRNAYDLVFNHAGDLFVHDSDMESDIGTVWHRSTGLYHVHAGADLGWRSGWANLPSWSADTTPPIADTGRGSPTGAVCYQHLSYPARFHNAMFLADWSEGRILAVHALPNGSTWTVATETFLTGRPMNVTDLAVGEDGALYFCTGGRGTWGGVFRVTWQGEIPEELLNYESSLAKALRMPQPSEAWARQNLAIVASSFGSEWATTLAGAALETRNSIPIRTRAIDLLQLYSTNVPVDSLEKLLEDENAEIRARTIRLCSQRKLLLDRLEPLLEDSSPLVQRVVCEAMLSAEINPSTERLLKLLDSEDRTIALTAMRLAQRNRNSDWFDGCLKSKSHRAMIMGSLARMSTAGNLETSYRVLESCSLRFRGFVNDRDFVDLLRVVRIAMVTGNVEPEKIPAFVEQLKSEFPTSHPVLNRELAQTLVALKAGNFGNTWSDYLNKSGDGKIVKDFIALHLTGISDALSDREQVSVLEYLADRAQPSETSGNARLYLLQGMENLAGSLPEKGIATAIARGTKWPAILPRLFFRIEGKVDEQLVESLILLDKSLQSAPESAERDRARMGIIALLGESGIDSAMEHLRNLWREEEPRRADISLALAQHPDGKNWSYLVASLPILDNEYGAEIARKLIQVDQCPVDARHYRDLLELGYRMKERGAPDAVKLFHYWTQSTSIPESSDWQSALNSCTSIYGEKWPDAEPVEQMTQSVTSVKPASETTSATSLSTEKLISYIEGNLDKGNPESGMHVFKMARCADCHRFGSIGESTGPDLTSLASRFGRSETLRAIVNPHENVPPQYRASKILTTDGKLLTGLAIDNADGSVTIIELNGTKQKLEKNQIDERQLTATSAMPEGTLNDLSLEQVNDLMAYLYGRTRATVPAQPASVRK